jgi:hypothetical protein
MLKYLFTTEYENGEVFKQTPDDISQTDSKRSAFYDVLNSGKKPIRFWIEGKGLLKDKYLVDLTDGHFEINGKSIVLDEFIYPEYRLIFFRQHQHDQVIDLKTNERKETAHRIKYFIGWQTTFKRKNIKRLIGVD